MAQKVFTAQYLKEQLHLPYNKNLVVSDTITGTGRWNIRHSLVFKDPQDGRLYRAPYSIGATEMQLEEPWENIESVHAMEVELRKVISEEYVDIDSIGALEQDRASRTPAAEKAGAPADNSQQEKKGIAGYMLSKNGKRYQNRAGVFIERADFEKFCRKLSRHLDGHFPGSAHIPYEVTLHTPNGLLKVSRLGGDMSYPLADLYAEYISNRKCGITKPLRVISDRIWAESEATFEPIIGENDAPEWGEDESGPVLAEENEGLER